MLLKSLDGLSTSKGFAVSQHMPTCACPCVQDFVLGVHERAATAGVEGAMTKRAEIMLELVIDIKNNRKRDVSGNSKSKASGSSSKGGAAAVLQPGVIKWLKQSGVDDVKLVNLSWKKLVTPDKKGRLQMQSMLCPD